jgi:hypothetical protein
MAEFFDRTRGGMTLYFGSEEGYSDVRFMLMHHGEDRELAMKAFWEEHGGDFAVVPIVAYGFVPRRELCTQRSLVDALQTVRLEAGGHIEMKWRDLCQQMNVSWPARLKPKAA